MSSLIGGGRQGLDAGTLGSTICRSSEMFHHGVGQRSVADPGCTSRFLKCALGLPKVQVSRALSRAEGPDRPAEAAAEPPSEGKGGLKQSTPKGAGVGETATRGGGTAGRTTHQ
jgi:hypothetical protein